MPAPRHNARPNPEAGYMLLACVVMVALILIALSVAAPVVTRDLRRDKEVESMHRAQEYVRAIRLFQRACKCTAYPGSMDALEKNTTVRFLRQKYTDPLTGKSDWRLIHNPQTKIHIPFGMELVGLSGGLGSAAGLASGGAAPGGPTSALAAGFSNSSSGASGSTGAPGATGASGASGGSGSAGMFGDGSGGVIYGVGTSRTGESILNPNQQTTYETWEFWYDPRIEAYYKAANVMGGGGMGSSSASGFGQDAGSFGGTGSTGSTGATGSSGVTFGGSTSH